MMQSKRILLLEDDPEFGKTLAKFLQRNGYDVDIAEDGRQALELSYRNRYDLYLFDVNVPLINGIELLGELREATDRTPTLIISALSDIDSVTKGFEAGADDYLKKPFDPQELLVRIRAKIGELQNKKRVGRIELDLQNDAIYLDKERIYLPEVQKRILTTLLIYSPDFVDKEALLDLLDVRSDTALRVHMAKLKKRWGISVENLRGVGYRIV